MQMYAQVFCRACPACALLPSRRCRVDRHPAMVQVYVCMRSWNARRTCHGSALCNGPRPDRRHPARLGDAGSRRQTHRRRARLGRPARRGQPRHLDAGRVRRPAPRRAAQDGRRLPGRAPDAGIRPHRRRRRHGACGVRHRRRPGDRQGQGERHLRRGGPQFLPFRRRRLLHQPRGEGRPDRNGCDQRRRHPRRPDQWRRSQARHRPVLVRRTERLRQAVPARHGHDRGSLRQDPEPDEREPAHAGRF